MYCVVKHYESLKSKLFAFYDFSEMDSVVTEVTAVKKVLRCLTQHGKEVLRFPVLWKNIWPRADKHHALLYP